MTTAGISTASSPSEVVAAYPGATHTVGSFGFESVVSLGLGVSWTKSVNPYFGTVSINMAIFPARDIDPGPDPDPGPQAIVDSIQMMARRKAITATVTIADGDGSAISGAVVDATWTLPDGSEVATTATTNRRGVGKFSIEVAPGTFTILIEDVSADGYSFGGGITTATIQN
jgi:hypothetical protein